MNSVKVIYTHCTSGIGSMALIKAVEAKGDTEINDIYFYPLLV